MKTNLSEAVLSRKLSFDLGQYRSDDRLFWHSNICNIEIETYTQLKTKDLADIAIRFQSAEDVQSIRMYASQCKKNKCFKKLANSITNFQVPTLLKKTLLTSTPHSEVVRLLLSARRRKK